MSDIGRGGVEMAKGSSADLEQSASAAAYQATGDDPGPRARRFWSTRRVPATVVAVVLAGFGGLLLYDVVLVRTDHPAMEWRRRLVAELASRQLDDAWILGGSAGAVAVGLWLLVLALTPGRRRLLPMRRDAGPPAAGTAGAGAGGTDVGARAEDVRAGIERSAVGLVLRDRAMDIAGVRSVRVKVSRRKVKARAQAHFRDLDDVRADLDAVLGDGIRQLGLARRPGLSVHVRRPAKG
jgi:hypothetical protein